MNLSPFLLHIWRQSDARYISHPMSCAPHICWFVPCQLRSLSNLAKLLLYIFMINHSNHRIAVCIADMPTIRCAIYATCCQTQCILSGLSYVTCGRSQTQRICNYLQLCISKATYLRFYGRYDDNSVSVMLLIFW